MVKAAFLFPGQGSQEVGMGKSLYDNSEKAKEIFELADEILGRSISGLCFDGPDDDLKQTENTQPALFVTAAAAVEVLREKGVEPSMVAGHSLGEYPALYAAGGFDFETGLRLVAVRGQAMASAGSDSPGGMGAVIGLDIAKIDEICVAVSQENGVVVVANDNSPGQTVISGDKGAVETACDKLKEAGAKRALPLPVSGAFHSPLMKDAQDKVAAQLAESALRVPRCPVFPNVRAESVDDPELIRKSLIDQITGRVRWVETMQIMAKSGMDSALEVGPGKVLMGLMRRIDKSIKVKPVGTYEAIEGEASDA